MEINLNDYGEIAKEFLKILEDISKK